MQADTLHVPGEFATIQAALDVAVDGDEIEVADGVYTGEGNRDLGFGGKALTLRSANGAAACQIDCAGVGRGILLDQSEGPNTVVDGFTIANGYYNGGSRGGGGGGIYCYGSSPTIRNCVIENNRVEDSAHGGGILGRYANPVIEKCVIRANVSDGGGGISLWYCDADIRDCRITANSAPIAAFGGGLYCFKSNVLVDRCTIDENDAYGAGGVQFYYGTKATVVDCVISRNRSGEPVFDNGWGGGAGIVCYSDADVTFANCLISDNQLCGRAWYGGAGLLVMESAARLMNCVVARNKSDDQDAAVKLRTGTLVMTNSTVIANDGNGLYGIVFSEATMTNSIFWGNEREIDYYDSKFDVTYCDVQGGHKGKGNIDRDPRFAFPDDPHVLKSSPCIDKGTNDPPGGLPETDADGNARVLDGNNDGQDIADMGVYEYNAQGPSIAASPGAVFFSAQMGGSPPAAQTLEIRNCGGSTLQWDTSINADWLVVDPIQGESDGEVDRVTLTVLTTDLPAGDHEAALRIRDENAVNNPKLIPITFRVNRERHVPAEYSTIQAAIDAALDGDAVVLADGVHSGVGNKMIEFRGKAVTVRSEHGPWRCAIDLEGSGSAFIFEGGESLASVIEGVTIRNADNLEGGAIRCRRSSPTIRNCVFLNNLARRFGGALDLDETDAVVSNCLFTGNRTSYTGGAIGLSQDRATITNCTFVGNQAYDSRGGGGAIGARYSNETSITNCILWGNGDRQIAEQYESSLAVTHSDVQGGWSGTGNINVDPGFAFADDFHLTPGSQCIDRGTQSPPGGLAERDIDGALRNADGDGDGGAAPDMGAFELDRTRPTLAVSPAAPLILIPDGADRFKTQVLQIRNAGGEVLRWSVSADCPWLLAEPESGELKSGATGEILLQIDASGLPFGSRECPVEIVDDEATNSPKLMPISVHVGGIARVPSEFASIQAAINACEAGDTVLVADGTYTGPGNRDMTLRGKAITVRSENGPETCVVDGEWSGRGFHFAREETHETVVDGFTLTRMMSRESDQSGGAVYCWYSSPVVRDCVMRDNAASGGGVGVFSLYGSPAIQNCRITQSQSEFFDVTGVHVFGGNPVLTDCEIADLTAPSRNAWAVRAYLTTQLDISNCTIASNSGREGGGVYVLKGKADLSNCVVWGNSSYQIAFDGDGSGIVVSYSNVQGGWTGEGNLDADPLFVESDQGDYRLMGASPCIDAGDPKITQQDRRVDLSGNLRVWNARIDIGAFEFGSFAYADANCDGTVAFDDVDAFVLALIDAETYQEKFPACRLSTSDLNADGNVDFDDIDRFISCLTDGGCD